MTPWLVVTLRAPLASFGERAGNVERSTAERPTRSALLGLAGAALGIRRADAAGQANLARSFRVATQTIDAGALVSDFHTFQSLPSARGRPATRARALARRGDLVTSITRREYRTDIWFEAAYTVEEGARWSLEELADAFRNPRFTLYLGRKSCPLGAPLAPRIVEEAAGVADAFRRDRASSAYADPANELFDRCRARWSDGPVAAERRGDLGASNRPLRQHRRVDEPGDRLAWQFAAREEFILARETDDPEGAKR